MPSFFAHPHLAFKHTHSDRILKLSLLSLMIACAHSTFANEHFDLAEKSRTTAFKQIGNAVPVKLAGFVAEKIMIYKNKIK